MAGYTHAAGLFTTNGDYSAADYLADHSGGFMASQFLAEPEADNFANGILCRKGAGSMNAVNAVAAMWQGVEIIRDQYTNARSGQVNLTVIALWDFRTLRKAAY